MKNLKKILITGGAGYIGTALTPSLLQAGVEVRVCDTLLHGGDAMLAFLNFPNYHFHHGDVRDRALLDRLLEGVDAVIHLAALVGFPVCKKVGREHSWDVNVEGTRAVYEGAHKAGVERMIFASSYSNYGVADNGVVREDSPLRPQSVYAESKVAAEEFLLERCQDDLPAVTCVRLATLFGVSPRTRFDLMVNQFALTAHLGQKLVIYQKDFNRAFVHVQDVVRALTTLLEAPRPQVAGQVFNIGGESLNSSKARLVEMIRARWTDLVVEERELQFDGDMRSIHVCFEKVRKTLGFEPCYTLEQGIEELHRCLTLNLIAHPEATRHRNHPVLVT